MANVWFCSDLHFGHKNIQKHRLEVKSEQDNRNRIKDDWNKLVTKRDVVYVLGDACFDSNMIKDFAELKGKKILIRGNHDLLPIQEYLTVFDEVYGLLKYKEFWLSHAPIHEEELRGRYNLHGHVHYHNVPDYRSIYPYVQDHPKYLNCCPENLWDYKAKCLISLHEVREYFKSYYNNETVVGT